MAKDKKQILGHVLACGTQIMWGATFCFDESIIKAFFTGRGFIYKSSLGIYCVTYIFTHHLKLKDLA